MYSPTFPQSTSQEQMQLHPQNIWYTQQMPGNAAMPYQLAASTAPTSPTMIISPASPQHMDFLAPQGFRQQKGQQQHEQRLPHIPTLTQLRLHHTQQLWQQQQQNVSTLPVFQLQQNSVPPSVHNPFAPPSMSLPSDHHQQHQQRQQGAFHTARPFFTPEASQYWSQSTSSPTPQPISQAERHHPASPAASAAATAAAIVAMTSEAYAWPTTTAAVVSFDASPKDLLSISPSDFGNMPVVIDPAPLVNNSSPLANPGRHCLVGPELDALYTFDRSGTHVNLSHGSQGQVTNGGVRDDESVEGTEVDDDEARFQLWQGSNLSSTPPLSPPNNAELPYQYRQPPQQQHQCYPYPYQQHSQRQSENLLVPHDQASSDIQTELLLQSLTGLSSSNSTTTLESPSASGLSTRTLHLMLGADQTDLNRGLGSSGEQQPLHQQQQPKKQQRRTKKQKQQSISLPSQLPAHSPLTLLATQAEQVIGNSVDEKSMARLMDGADPGFGSRQPDAAAAIHIPEARLFQCQLCHKRFLRQYNLNAHHKTHSLERAYRCHDCPRSFLRPYDLSRHQRIHSKDKPYSCEICDMVFIRNDAIWRHYRKDHPDHPDVPVSRRDRKRQRNTIVAVAAAMAASRTARAASKSSAKTSTGRAKRGPAKAPKNAIVVTNA